MISLINDGQHFHQNQNEMNNHLPPQLIEHKEDHDIWNWKSRSWHGTGSKCDWVKLVNRIPTPPFS
jgi:hypothetical protein